MSQTTPLMPDPLEPFAFVDGGRTFTCCVETARRPHVEMWWWFRVSTESHQRYAPFRAEASDTVDAIRHRVVAYYDDLLARRAEPVRSHWSRNRPAAAAAPAA